MATWLVPVDVRRELDHLRAEFARLQAEHQRLTGATRLDRPALEEHRRRLRALTHQLRAHRIARRQTRSVH